jgi:hypothetical protein
MAATGPGLNDVLEIALTDWSARAERGGSSFGAAGPPGFAPDPEMIDLVHNPGHLLRGFPREREALYSPDPFRRMFDTDVGLYAARAVGNESRTLDALRRVSVEVMAQALLQERAQADDRLLAIPAQDARPPVLMWMSPRVTNVRDSSLVSADVNLPFQTLYRQLETAADSDGDDPESVVLRQILRGGPAALAETFLIARPEIVLTRKPRMIPLCVVAPHLRVESGTKISTAGILVRDVRGDRGITAAFHATGPIGTRVVINGRHGTVKAQSEVQDLVFVAGDFEDPARDQIKLCGTKGVLEDREPAKADRVRFDGATNQDRWTRIFSTDTGLLRARPTIMLKLQTEPDTDAGDSGCALIDRDDRVLGFAFERTAYDDYPQFTDWIWAANALRALGLVPLTETH